MIDETNVREFLHEQASDVDPADSRVDVRLAIQTGGRRRQRRALLTGGVAVLTVLAIGGAAVAVRGAAPPKVVTPAASPTGAPAKAEPLDPFIQRIALPATPAGLTEFRQEFTAAEQRLSFSQLGPTPGAPEARSASRQLVLVLLAKGTSFGSEAGDGPPGKQPSAEAQTDPKRGQPGPAVGGHRSYWVDKGETSATLMWEWTPGGWAGITTVGYASGAAAAVTTAAQQVWLGERPVRLPFSLPRPPAQLKVFSVSSSVNGDGSVEGDVTFSDVPDATDPQTHIPRQLSVGTQKSPAGNTYKGTAANTAIAGHPAYLSTLDSDDTGDASSALLFGISGQMLAITVYDRATEKYVPRAQLKSMITSMRLVTNPRDVSTWVNPLR